MIRRETDAALVNRIVNDPSVYDRICYHGGQMDWTPVVEQCVVLSNGEDAVGAFEPTGDRVFQTHTIFLPTCRGARALATGREMLAFMRDHADRIWGATPINNPAARWFNRQLGCRVIGRDEYEAEGPVELFELELV